MQQISQSMKKLMKDFSGEHSFLSVHNFGSGVSEFYELHVPYMIIYQTCKTTTHECDFLQMVPGRHIHTTFSSLEFPYVNQRSQHHHDFFEAMFVLSGSVRQHVEHKCLEYTAGQCCILNRNIHHCEEFTTDFELIFLMISDQFLKNLMERDIRYTTEGAYHSCFGAIYHLIEQNQRSKYYEVKEYIDFQPEPTLWHQDSGMMEIQVLINQMIDETVRQLPGCFFIVEGLLSRFFSILENPDLYRKTHVKLAGNSQEQLLVKISHILEERHGRVTREELESMLNYNGDYINRIIKKQTGMTFLEYGQLFCLKEAERCLLETDQSITDIVHALGFSNRSYFNRMFIKKYGMPPKEYRQNNR